MDEGRQKEEEEENVNTNHIEQKFHLVLGNVGAFELATSVIVIVIRSTVK